MALALAVGALAMSGALAATVNVTVADWNGPGASLNKPVWGWNGGPAGVGAEDNETEYGTYRGQIWDLEAFVFNSDTKKLSLIGGYDLENGLTDGAPGDLFIKIGGVAGFNPITPTGDVANGTYYQYDYAVRLSQSLAGPTVSVIDLNASSQLNTVANDYMGSNPWKWSSGSDAISAAGVDYQASLTAEQVAAQYGVSGLLKGAYTAGDAQHNVVTIDLSFLVSEVEPDEMVWLGYTMQCGNDMIHGTIPSGGFRTPDGGLTLAMMGLALGGLGLVSRKLRR